MKSIRVISGTGGLEGIRKQELKKFHCKITSVYWDIVLSQGLWSEPDVPKNPCCRTDRLRMRVDVFRCKCCMSNARSPDSPRLRPRRPKAARSSSAVLLEFPVPVVEWANLAGFKPPRYAVEVKCVLDSRQQHNYGLEADLPVLLHCRSPKQQYILRL